MCFSDGLFVPASHAETALRTTPTRVAKSACVARVTIRRVRIRVAVHHTDFYDLQSSVDIEANAIIEDVLDRVDDMVSEMDLERRTVFYGLMRHQGRNEGLRIHEKGHGEGLRNGPHKQISDALGVSKSRVYQLRDDVRKKLRVIH